MKAFKAYWQNESFLRLVVCVYWLIQWATWLWLLFEIGMVSQPIDLLGIQASLSKWNDCLLIQLYFDSWISISFWQWGLLIISFLAYWQLRLSQKIGVILYVGVLGFCLGMASSSLSLTILLGWLKLMVVSSFVFGSVFIYWLISGLIQILADISHNFPHSK